jgi:hypothetical protein
VSKKKKKQQKRKDFDQVIRTITQPQLESYVYGFLQGRGFDLHPRVKETKEGYLIALYYDRGEKGWWRIFQLELSGKEDPAWFALGVALVNHLYNSGVAPRSPCPIGEPTAKMLRNTILGQLQDGISPEIAMQLLNHVSGTFTAHLRPRDMVFDFGDGQEPGAEPEDDDSVDPVLEEELAMLDEEIEKAEDDGAGIVEEGEELDNVVDLPKKDDDDAGEGIAF